MEGRSCSSSRDEELYVLEVFVDRVSLYADRLEKVDPSSLGTDLMFADFPLFRFFQTEFHLTEHEKRKRWSREAEFRNVHFGSGRTHLSTRNPMELIEKMRSSPILVDVYRVKGILNCPYEVLKDPLGNATIPLPGCLCDQVSMADNEPRYLPKAYQIRNTFALIDEQQMPSGFISLLIRLTCLGKSTAGQYSIVGKKLLFKNAGSPNEFLCSKVPLLDEEERRAAEEGTKTCIPGIVLEESELDAPVRPPNLAGLTLVCRELSASDVSKTA